MKKNLTFLTGIVFLITILVAVVCCSDTNQKESKEAGDDPKTVVYLSEIEMGGSMHLLMSHSRKPGCEVIDGLITDVNPVDTVYFMKGKNSRIDEVKDIRLLEKVFEIRKEKYPIEADAETRDVLYYMLIIDSHISPDSIAKYEIEFTVRGHKDTTYTIDPYLRLPKETDD